MYMYICHMMAEAGSSGKTCPKTVLSTPAIVLCMVLGRIAFSCLNSPAVYCPGNLGRNPQRHWNVLCCFPARHVLKRYLTLWSHACLLHDVCGVIRIAISYSLLYTSSHPVGLLYFACWKKRLHDWVRSIHTVYEWSQILCRRRCSPWTKLKKP